MVNAHAVLQSSALWSQSDLGQRYPNGQMPAVLTDIDYKSALEVQALAQDLKPAQALPPNALLHAAALSRDMVDSVAPAPGAPVTVAQMTAVTAAINNLTATMAQHTQTCTNNMAALRNDIARLLERQSRIEAFQHNRNQEPAMDRGLAYVFQPIPFGNSNHPPTVNGHLTDRSAIENLNVTDIGHWESKADKE